MPSLFSHQHPIEKTYIKSRDLVAAVNKLMRIRDQIGRSPTMYHCIESLNERKRNLQTSVETEFEWWSVCGASSRQGTWNIKYCFAASWPLYGSWTKTLPRRTDSPKENWWMTWLVRRET